MNFIQVSNQSMGNSMNKSVALFFIQIICFMVLHLNFFKNQVISLQP
jgi:hypothetical protein